MLVCTFKRDNRRKNKYRFLSYQVKTCLCGFQPRSTRGTIDSDFQALLLTAQWGKNREWQVTPFLHFLASFWTISSRSCYQNIRARFGAGAKTNLFFFLHKGVRSDTLYEGYHISDTLYEGYHWYERMPTTNFNLWRLFKIWERE